jgi:hypothetical protein
MFIFAMIAIYSCAPMPANAARGINYGWCRYSGFSNWLGSSYSLTATVMNSDFALIHHTGKISAVRIWIFPDGTSNVNLSGQVSSTFISNVKAVVSAANANGLSVYVTFFSAWNQGDATSGNEAAIWNDDINPILSALVGHYNIFGVDVMNEFDGTGSNSTFCKYIVGKIRSSYSSVKVTASSNQSYSTAVNDEKNLGANMLDIHVYSNSINLPTNSSGLTGVIGEVGSSNGGVSAQTTTLDAALSQYSSRGWSSIFAWDFALDDAWELTTAGTGFTTVSWNSGGSSWANF